MRRSHAVGAALLVALASCLVSCFVKGLCHTDEDCSGNETCNVLNGECRVECTRDTDCYVNGQPSGRECFNHRCQWRLDERVKAPSFCLEVINPKSSQYGKKLCIDKLEGKVVLIYFSLLA
jgi:hypothetical protein